jgi:Fe-S cluster biogenesis protein NfuA
MPDELAAAVEQLRVLVRGDGADLRLVGVDDRAHVVEVALLLDDANCGDCVLPPGRLRDVLAAGLVERGVTSHRLVLHDPRVADGVTRLIVLDPTAETAAAIRDPGPDAGPLAGRTVGFRVDVLWQSWDWVVDEWTTMLVAARVAVGSWRRVQGLPDPDGAYPAFLDDVDVAVVGLGNCGSCTSWTIKDAVEAARERPTVAVVTEQFVALAATLATHYGRPGLRTHALPFPLQGRPEHEVRAIARDAFPALLTTMGATV